MSSKAPLVLLQTTLLLSLFSLYSCGGAGFAGNPSNKDADKDGAGSASKPAGSESTDDSISSEDSASLLNCKAGTTTTTACKKEDGLFKNAEGGCQEIATGFVFSCIAIDGRSTVVAI